MLKEILFLLLSISAICCLDFYITNNTPTDYKVGLYFKPVPNNQFGPYSQIWQSQVIPNKTGLGPYSLGTYFSIIAVNPSSQFITGPAFCYEGDIIEFNGTLKWVGKSSAISHGIRVRSNVHIPYSYSLGLGFPLITAKNVLKNAEVDIELEWKIYVLVVDKKDITIQQAHQFQSSAYDNTAYKFKIGGTINEIIISEDIGSPRGIKVKMVSY